MLSQYHRDVDPRAPNNAHAYQLELVGWNRRVLELGAASGHMTQALVAQDCQVTSVELDRQCAEQLRGIAEEVVIGDLNNPDVFADLEPEFDVVLAGDVLEHLLRPQAVLSRAAGLLRPGGYVVVSLPHVGHVDMRLSLAQGEWEYRAWGLLDSTHTRFFTLKSIKQLAKEAGLVITDLRRVRIPVFETELALEREQVPTATLELALRDPEAETYQFVFAATRETGGDRLRRAAERNVELATELERLRIAHGALEAEQGALEASNRALIASNRELEARAQRLGELELFSKRIDDSVSWQALQRLRARLFRAAGGERSAPVKALQAGLRQFGRLFLSSASRGS